MATNNSWNNQVNAAYNQIILNAGTNGVAISTDVSAATVNIATGGAVKTTTLGSLNSTSATTINSGSGDITIGQNGGTGAVKIGNTTGNTSVTGTLTTSAAITASTGNITATTGALVTINNFINAGNTAASTASSALQLLKNRSGGIITSGDGLGSITFSGYDGTQYVNGAAISSLNSGTVGINRVAGNLGFATHPDSTSGGASATTRMTIASTGEVTIASPDSGTGLTVSGGGITVTTGAVSINSGTAAFGLSTDASATTVNIATGSAAKVVTLGSTSGASSLALKTGTADFSLSSATGTIMSALDTGEITYPLQTAFLGYLASSDLNRTGNNTIYVIGTNTAFTEVFDQNSDFNTNGVFTAPVTGRYEFNGSIRLTGCTICTNMLIGIITSNRTYFNVAFRAASASDFMLQASALADMDAGDTASIEVQAGGEAGDTDDILGGANPQTYFSGYLAC